jgi:hypothetical protein
METLYEKASLILNPGVYDSGKVYVTKPFDGSGDLTFSRASTATRVNASGLIETVASGVPRLDYLNSSCPRLLLEPAATNLAILSTDYSGAGWAKSGVTLLEDRNQPDPFGGNNASIIRIDSIGGSIQRATTGSSGTQYSGAFWIKRIAGTGDCNLRVVENANIVVPVTNQWQRFTATRTSTTTVLRIGVGGATIGDEFAIYQAQLETGPVSTSDIITGGATVTRLADAASKTGISSLIGQTEGTLFAEVDVQNLIGAVSRGILVVSDGTTLNRVQFLFTSASANTIRMTLQNSSTLNLSLPISTTGIYKLAVGYTAGGTADFFINGTQVGTTSSIGSFTNTLSIIDVGTVIGGAAPLSDGIKQSLLFKTRLTNAQLAELTA